jgi:hypothetical protein
LRRTEKRHLNRANREAQYVLKKRESVFANILLVRQIESTFCCAQKKETQNRAKRGAECVLGCSKNGETISWRDKVNRSLQIFFRCDKSNPPFAAHRKKTFKSGGLQNHEQIAKRNVFWAVQKAVKMAKCSCLCKYSFGATNRIYLLLCIEKRNINRGIRRTMSKSRSGMCFGLFKNGENGQVQLSL